MLDFLMFAMRIIVCGDPTFTLLMGFKHLVYYLLPPLPFIIISTLLGRLFSRSSRVAVGIFPFSLKSEVRHLCRGRRLGGQFHHIYHINLGQPCIQEPCFVHLGHSHGRTALGPLDPVNGYSNTTVYKILLGT